MKLIKELCLTLLTLVMLASCATSKMDFTNTLSERISNDWHSDSVRFHHYLRAKISLEEKRKYLAKEIPKEFAKTEKLFNKERDIFLKYLKKKFDQTHNKKQKSFKAGLAVMIRKIEFEGESLFIEDVLSQSDDIYAKYLADYVIKTVPILRVTFSSGKVIYDLGMGTEGHLTVGQPEKIAQLVAAHNGKILNLNFSKIVPGKYLEKDLNGEELWKLGREMKSLEKKTTCTGGELVTNYTTTRSRTQKRTNGRLYLVTTTRQSPTTHRSQVKCNLNSSQKSALARMKARKKELSRAYSKAVDAKNTGHGVATISALNQVSTEIKFELTLLRKQNKLDEDILKTFLTRGRGGISWMIKDPGIEAVWAAVRKYYAPSEYTTKVLREKEDPNVIWRRHALRIGGLAHKGITQQGENNLEKDLRYIP